MDPCEENDSIQHGIGNLDKVNHRSTSTNAKGEALTLPWEVHRKEENSKEKTLVDDGNYQSKSDPIGDDGPDNWRMRSSPRWTNVPTKWHKTIFILQSVSQRIRSAPA